MLYLPLLPLAPPFLALQLAASPPDHSVFIHFFISLFLHLLPDERLDDRRLTLHLNDLGSSIYPLLHGLTT